MKMKMRGFTRVIMNRNVFTYERRVAKSSGMRSSRLLRFSLSKGEDMRVV